MEGAGELHTDLTNFFDGFTGMEHSLPVRLYNDVVTLTARSGTAYTPTLIVSYGGPAAEIYWYQHANPHDDARLRRFTPHEMLDGLGRRRPWYPEDEFHFPTVAAGAAEVARAGGRVCLGAHGQLQGLGAHWEMWAFTVGKGMTPMEALRTATWSGAEALGFGKDLGSLETGKLADLVVIDGDPLKDIHDSQKVAYTMKGGTLYDASTRPLSGGSSAGLLRRQLRAPLRGRPATGYFGGSFGAMMICPPSTTSVVPVRKSQTPEARKTIAVAISDGSAARGRTPTPSSGVPRGGRSIAPMSV